jgi:hypothetical protein
LFENPEILGDCPRNSNRDQHGIMLLRTDRASIGWMAAPDTQPPLSNQILLGLIQGKWRSGRDSNPRPPA